MDEEDENSMSPPKAFAPRKAAKRRSSGEESSPDMYGKKTKHGSSGEESSLEASFEAPVLEQDIFGAPILEQDISESLLPGPSERRTRSLDYQYQQALTVQKLEHMVSNSRSISHIPSAIETRLAQPCSSTASSFTLHSNVQVINEEMDTSEIGERSNPFFLTAKVEGRINVRKPVCRAGPVDIYPDDTSARCANANCNKSLSRKWAVTCETNDQHVYCMVCMMSYYNTHSEPWYCPSGENCVARLIPTPWQSTYRHVRLVKMGYNQNH